MPYEKHRRRGSRADDYLCRLCKESQASVWDHCHEHGFVRGPLCGSCNSSEGSRHPHYFLERDGGTLHLLECRACLEERTLPFRYSQYVVREHLMRTERHGRCRKQPYVREVEHTDGVHRFHLECSGWHTASNWTKEVTAAEVVLLVQAFVDAALAAQEGQRA